MVRFFFSAWKQPFDSRMCYFKRRGFAALVCQRLLLLSFLLTGCAQIDVNTIGARNPVPSDVSATSAEPGKYNPGENLVFLALSGSGTRAAALGYSVMRVLEGTRFLNESGAEVSLLQDLDHISAVSGGSYPAAYYAAFKERLFDEFESALIRQTPDEVRANTWFSPDYWWQALRTGFNVTALAVWYYDTLLFEGRTFADIASHGWPRVTIAATDLAEGVPFRFNADRMQQLCLGGAPVSLAHAVVASSAWPMGFPNLVLERTAGDCKSTQMGAENYEKSLVSGGVEQKDSHFHFLHLTDGAFSDPLALYALSSEMAEVGRAAAGKISRYTLEQPLKRVVLILVNSMETPMSEWVGHSAELDPRQAIKGLSNLLYREVGEKSKGDFYDLAADFKLLLSDEEPNLEFYILEVSYQAIASEHEGSFVAQLPTGSTLSEAQIDAVMASASRQLNESRQFQSLLRSLRAKPVHGNGH
ncbi:MAG: hypothetical protein C9356_03685 [Oleiphilus sp.]|nr:MAG: hypothetical protein C9356_03685 [Oleiphilus sp.]